MRSVLIATIAVLCLGAAPASAFFDSECKGNSCNDVTASGGDGGQGGDADVNNIIFSSPSVDVGNGFGNFSPSARGGSSDSDADATVNIGSSGFLSGDTLSPRSNSDADARSSSGASSGSESGATSVVNINQEASHIPKPAAASPASVYVNMCSQGGSFSTPGGGATVGGGSDFCKKMALADAYFRHGDEDTGWELMGEARSDLDRGTSLIHLLQLDRIPFVRNYM